MNTRDKEMKDKDDFATQNYNDKDMPLSRKALREAEMLIKQQEKDEQEDTTPPNFNVNYITDEVFEKELECMTYVPQGESVIVLGPKVDVPKTLKDSSVTITESAKDALLKEQLKKHKSGYRVVAISSQVIIQQYKPIVDLSNALDESSINETVVSLQLATYGVGQYVFSPRTAVVRQMDFIQPLDPTLAYYEVFHREIAGFVSQANVEKFKPVDQVVEHINSQDGLEDESEDQA